MKEVLMKSHLRAMVLTIAVIVTLCQSALAWASHVHDRSDSSGTVTRTLDQVNPVFVVTEAQLRKAFDDAELRGEKKQGMNAGDLQTTDVLAQNPLGGTETLQMRILFTSPLDQLALNGYMFGQVAKQRTPADRKAFEDLSIKRGLANQNQATFRVFLQQPTNSDATIPVIHFRLLDNKGNQISPAVEPTSFVASGRDLIGAVALEEEGQPLTFPILEGAVPLITPEMTTLTVIVLVGEESRQLTFKLR